MGRAGCVGRTDCAGSIGLGAVFELNFSGTRDALLDGARSAPQLPLSVHGVTAGIVREDEKSHRHNQEVHWAFQDKTANGAASDDS